MYQNSNFIIIDLEPEDKIPTLREQRTVQKLSQQLDNLSLIEKMEEEKVPQLEPQQVARNRVLVQTNSNPGKYYSIASFSHPTLEENYQICVKTNMIYLFLTPKQYSRPKKVESFKLVGKIQRVSADKVFEIKKLNINEKCTLAFVFTKRQNRGRVECYRINFSSQGVDSFEMISSRDQSCHAYTCAFRKTTEKGIRKHPTRSSRRGQLEQNQRNSFEKNASNSSRLSDEEMQMIRSGDRTMDDIELQRIQAQLENMSLQENASFPIPQLKPLPCKSIRGQNIVNNNETIINYWVAFVTDKRDDQITISAFKIQESDILSGIPNITDYLQNEIAAIYVVKGVGEQISNFEFVESDTKQGCSIVFFSGNKIFIVSEEKQVTYTLPFLNNDQIISIERVKNVNEEIVYLTSQGYSGILSLDGTPNPNFARRQIEKYCNGQIEMKKLFFKQQWFIIYRSLNKVQILNSRYLLKPFIEFKEPQTDLAFSTYFQVNKQLTSKLIVFVSYSENDDKFYITSKPMHEFD